MTYMNHIYSGNSRYLFWNHGPWAVGNDMNPLTFLFLCFVFFFFNFQAYFCVQPKYHTNAACSYMIAAAAGRSWRCQEEMIGHNLSSPGLIDQIKR